MAKTRKRKPPESTIEFLHTAFDDRISCRYILMTMQVNEFLRLVKSAYESQGSIEGQRDVVRTATATRIRRRMAADLEQGAIIPPIVLGATAAKAAIGRDDWDTISLRGLIQKLSKISVIDGMQRTAVLLEHQRALANNTVRVELWLAPSTENLVYRMLILNMDLIRFGGHPRRGEDGVHDGQDETGAASSA